MQKVESGSGAASSLMAARSVGPGDLVESWYDRYARDLFRYAFALTGSAEDAEDAVQEAFAGVARQERRLLRVRDGRPYLVTATRNAAYSILRSRRRRGNLLDALKQGERATEDPPDPELSLSAYVQEGFAALPADQREVLGLKIFEELSFREIAHVTGVSLNTAASRYRYGIEKLRKLLEKQGDEGDD